MVQDWIYIIWTLNSGLVLPLKKIMVLSMNAGFPNDQAIGITAETGICVAFSKTGWWVYKAITLLTQFPALVGKDS